MTAANWQAVARRAALLAPAGPSAAPVRLRGVVSSLRDSAARALPMVEEITHLPTAAAARNSVYVVDRARWTQANVQVLALLLDDQLEEVPDPTELGAALALLSTKVLGQFDPFVGRLLLVAPNVMKLERELDVDVMDFRLWVSLHEQTHAVQFAAAPWLRGYLEDRVAQLTASVSGSDTGRLAQLLSTVRELLHGDQQDLLAAVLTAEEMAVFEEVTAVMSLLEGHADVVMDAVGPARLPSVRRIRQRFEHRRDAAGPIDLVLRRILGLDAKLAQYRDGAAFVRRVVERVGHPGLNAVWAGPENLPTPAEIRSPASWVRRVQG